jgi:hypothetical protein
MLFIRKQNFENEPCFCCTGQKTYDNDPDCAIAYQLYHKLPGGTQYLPAKVIIPRCQHCANKVRPVRLISLITAVIGVMSGFLYTFCCHGFWISLLCGAVWGGISYYAALVLFNFAFSIVYHQMGGDYQIVKILKRDYGWQITEPKRGQSDDSFTDLRQAEMFQQLSERYGCEFGDI